MDLESLYALRGVEGFKERKGPPSPPPPPAPEPVAKPEGKADRVISFFSGVAIVILVFAIFSLCRDLWAF
jgi:hypothetical protein